MDDCSPEFDKTSMPNVCLGLVVFNLEDYVIINLILSDIFLGFLQYLKWMCSIKFCFPSLIQIWMHWALILNYIFFDNMQGVIIFSLNSWWVPPVLLSDLTNLSFLKKIKGVFLFYLQHLGGGLWAYKALS